MRIGSRRADLFERALAGPQSADQEICDLVATAGQIPALTSAACAPTDEFVSALGIRLRAEALTLPAREVRTSGTEGRRRAGGSGTRPVVFVIGRRLPRVLAGVTASLLLVGAVVGGASRSALPGGLLYPVRHLLDSAAVKLAGSDLDRGVTLLSQAQEHVSDARALVERDGALADPASVDEALLSAYDAVSGGQRALLGEFDRRGSTQSLLAVQDFAVRALPQLNALRPLVPAGSRPEVDALIALLQETRTTLARRIAVCGQPCAALGGVGLGSSPSSVPPTGRSSTTAPGSLATPGLPAPGLPAPDPPIRGGLPVHDPKATITRPGAVVVGPSVSPLPITRSTSVAILPSVTVGSLNPSSSPVTIPTTVLPPTPTGLPGLP